MLCVLVSKRACWYGLGSRNLTSTSATVQADRGYARMAEVAKTPDALLEDLHISAMANVLGRAILVLAASGSSRYEHPLLCSHRP